MRLARWRWPVVTRLVFFAYKLSTVINWNAFDSKPDGFVSVNLDGNLLGNSSIVDDAYEATYADDHSDEFVESGTIVAGSTLTLTLKDEDVSENDIAFSCSIGLTPDVLRSRIFSCIDPDDSDNSIIFIFRPL
jgi:hypothetical protein